MNVEPLYDELAEALAMLDEATIETPDPWEMER